MCGGAWRGAPRCEREIPDRKLSFLFSSNVLERPERCAWTVSLSFFSCPGRAACFRSLYRRRIQRTFRQGVGLVTLALGLAGLLYGALTFTTYRDGLRAVRLGAADTDGRGRFLFWRCVLAGGAPEEAGSGKNAVGLAATLNSPQVALCFPDLRNSPHEL